MTDAHAHADAIPQSIEATRPPDVSDDRWETALRGLRAFLTARHGGKAEALGWPRDELYAVSPAWGVDLCGAALLIGDHEVIEDAIGIRTASRRRLLVRDADEDETWCRAFEHTVAFCCSHTGLDLESAKNMVLSAINQRGSTPP